MWLEHTVVHYLMLSYRCGIALDAWMLPIDEEQLEEEMEQPLLFVNCDFDFHWPASIAKMMKLVKPPDECGG